MASVLHSCFCPVLPLGTRENRPSSPYSSSLCSTKSAASFQILAAANNSTNHEIVRPLENFPPNMWGDAFLTLPFTNSEFDSCSRQVGILKGMVKEMLMTSMDPVENILLIYSICRLGVSYHFESEIEKQLGDLFTILPQLMEMEDYDLHTVAIIFQVFRSHGYRICCDVFNKFKSDGKFKVEVANDIKGMIRLYEASQWRMNGELILDEALSFTKLQLESIVSQLSSSYLAYYIRHALQWPHHKSIPRVDARHYISFYENDESRNDILLKFAKYDFNWVQMLHQQELSLTIRSWEKLNMESRIPYGRHRMVEYFFSAISQYFEPRFARGRDISAKSFVLIQLIDDTYDAYGIYEELQYFTKAIERSDISAMDDLPIEYLKILYEVVLAFFNELEEVSKEGRFYRLSYAKEELKRLVQAYDVGARWRQKCLELPTFDEYLENGKISIAFIAGMSFILTGMEEADQNAFEWFKNCQDKILEAVCILCRLYNDIQTNEREEKSWGQVSGTACYMKQYGVSRKEAIEAFNEMIEVAWKDLNEGFMRPSPVPTRILLGVLNAARLMYMTYNTDDGFTSPEMSYKHHIAKVLVDPIPI